MSSRPELASPPCWEPISETLMPHGSYPYMSCHWSDVRDGYVVPKYKGQIFYFADLYEMWVFRGYPEPEPQPSKWPTRIVIIIFLTLLGIDLWLAWYLFSRLEWL